MVIAWGNGGQLALTLLTSAIWYLKSARDKGLNAKALL
jgi:hypothetical protein